MTTPPGRDGGSQRFLAAVDEIVGSALQPREPDPLYTGVAIDPQNVPFPELLNNLRQLYFEDRVNQFLSTSGLSTHDTYDYAGFHSPQQLGAHESAFEHHVIEDAAVDDVDDNLDHGNDGGMHY